jgi:hypothetical protein
LEKKFDASLQLTTSILIQTFSHLQLSKQTMSQYNNTRANTRSEGQIDLLQMGVPADKLVEVAAMIVGSRGSGIKRYTAKVTGTYVKLFSSTAGRDVRVSLDECDTVYISGRSDADVQKVAAMVNQDVQAHFDPSVQSTRPAISTPCPPEAAGTVIGHRGENLKRIQRYIADGCYINHNYATGQFDITANDLQACQRAAEKIKDAIRAYFDEQKRYKRQKRRGGDQAPCQENTSSNSFSALGGDSTDDDSDLDEDAVREMAEQRRRKMANELQRAFYDNSSNSSIEQNKKDERYRWTVREELSTMNDPDTGAPLYEEYSVKDRTSGRLRHFTGIHAVPWSAVDQELQRRKAIGQRQADERQDRRSGLANHRQEQDRHKDSFFTPAKNHTAPIWGSGDMSQVTSAEGVEALKMSAKKPRALVRHNGPLELSIHLPTERPVSPKAKGMVALSLGKVATVETKRPVDLTPNVTLSLKPKEEKRSWADRVDDSDDEDFGAPIDWGTDKFVRPTEDNSAWD